MRSYKQHCGVAKALDVIGDQWALLIVRELLIRESCRYTDLKDGLPGIASNLLAARLKELERTGIISREEASPPVATALYRLTKLGRELEPIVLKLGQWGARMLVEAPSTDTFSSHWLALPLKLFLRDRTPDAPRVSVELRAGGEPVTVEAEHGELLIRVGAAKNPDAIITGDAMTILRFLAGKLDMSMASSAGLRLQGDISTVRRVSQTSLEPAATQTEIR